MTRDEMAKADLPFVVAAVQKLVANPFQSYTLKQLTGVGSGEKQLAQRRRVDRLMRKLVDAGLVECVQAPSNPDDRFAAPFLFTVKDAEALKPLCESQALAEAIFVYGPVVLNGAAREVTEAEAAQMQESFGVELEEDAAFQPVSGALESAVPNEVLFRAIMGCVERVEALDAKLEALRVEVKAAPAQSAPAQSAPDFLQRLDLLTIAVNDLVVTTKAIEAKEGNCAFRAATAATAAAFTKGRVK